jgi:hypothetical protein
MSIDSWRVVASCRQVISCLPQVPLLLLYVIPGRRASAPRVTAARTILRTRLTPTTDGPLSPRRTLMHLVAMLGSIHSYYFLIQPRGMGAGSQYNAGVFLSIALFAGLAWVGGGVPKRWGTDRQEAWRPHLRLVPNPLAHCLCSRSLRSRRIPGVPDRTGRQCIDGCPADIHRREANPEYLCKV